MSKKPNPQINYWIMKSEPEEFSIVDLKKKDISIWDGIRNYQVRNMIRDMMRVGDRAFFYHSSCAEIGIVGEMKIIKTAYSDPTQFKASSKYYDAGSKKTDPRWLSFDVKFIEKFPHIITLTELKTDPKFSDLPFVKKGNRLSIIPITKIQFELIHSLVR